MALWAWSNGRLCAESELHLPVRDEAVLYGASLFETLRCYNGYPFRLEQHLQRIRCWMERLRLFAHARQMVDLSTLAVRQAIAHLLEANGLRDGDARLRITVTAGSEQIAPSCFMLAERISPGQVAKWQAGIAAVRLPDPRSVTGELPKWGNYACHFEAQLLAKAQAAEEAIWFNKEGFLTEGALSNLFILHEHRLLTPPLEEGILAGITRQAIFEIAQQMGIECLEERIPLSLLSQAHAVFLTNSVREIVPVVRLDGVPLPKCLTVARLQEAYRLLVQQEIKAGW